GPPRFDEVFVHSPGPSDAPRDPSRLERMRHPRSVVVASRIDENLRLPLQAAKGLRMEDAVAIALERSSQEALLLGTEAAAGFIRARGERGGPAFLGWGER